jgi:hypothetical protein
MKTANRRLATILFAFAALRLLTVRCSQAQATTYYVSRSTGDDKSSGQAAQPNGNSGPWKTLARASIKYAAGDRLLLKCGDTWNEELHPQGSGAPDSPILIGSYGDGKKPLIDRLDDRQDRTGIHLANQQGFKILGLEFAHCMTGIFAEYAAGSPMRKFVWIEDCYFRDALFYGHYEDYPKRKIGIGISFFTYERKNNIVLADVTVQNCVFRRLASGIWTNNPDNFNKNASFIYNFGNFSLNGCLFEDGYQWQLGMRGVAGGAVRHCATHDIGRGFRSFNGVAGAMFFRCKDWVFEDSEWGFIDIWLGSGDGEAFDFEGNCDNMTMRNCLFHDTDGPCFLLCCYASDGNANRGIRMEHCVLNGKAKRPIRLPRCEIVNTTDWTESIWKDCRFYLSKGEPLMRVMDPEKDKRSSFADCRLIDLSTACSAPKLPAKLSASSSAESPAADAALPCKPTGSADQWLQLDFAKPTLVNEFRLKEAAGSSIGSYVIEYWDEKGSNWESCFHGRTIGRDFVAPVVGRTTQKARLRVLRISDGISCISDFTACNNTAGEVFSVARGSMPPARLGK